ncbi:MAG: 16S rRNA (cytidine(1402)-2'-O)-methyltransferase [bacterium]
MSSKESQIENTNVGGVLYVVGTPIGNLEDITLRALRILKSVDVILCEDTRTTRKLLSHYEIGTKTESFHTHSTDQKIDAIINLLSEGKNMAIVTDAGTPGISDPGALLVSRINLKNTEIAAPIKIEAVPGPSALTAAFSIAGITTSDFLFTGFIPHKKGRETLFKEMVESERAVVFYESTHRILKTLESLAKHFETASQSERKISIAREITKMYEELMCDTPQHLLEHLHANPVKTKGEFVCIVWPQ